MLDLQQALKENKEFCLNCLYCYAVCIMGAIEVEGELGCYKEQIRWYGRMIKKIA